VRAQRGTCSITPARSIETIHARPLTHQHSSHFTTFLSYFHILQFREKIKDTSLAKAEDIELLKWLIGENNSFF